MAKRIKIRKKRNKTAQHTITTKKVTQQTRKVPNWKCPVPDGVKGYWLKNFPALRERIATQMDDMINNGMDIPKLKTTGKIILCQKD